MRIAYKFIQNIVENADGSKRDVTTICNLQLFAATYKTLNDPFECSVRYNDEAAKDKFFQSKVNSLLFNAGICSLFKADGTAKYPCSETMWSYYGNSHKGFCIAYDLDAFSESEDFDIIESLDILYQDNSPIIYSSDSVEIIRQKLFGRKSSAWNKENEVRLLFNSSGLKKIPPNAIVAIFFGLNMPLKYRQEIISGLEHTNIEFYQIETIPNCYKLKATKLMGTADFEILNFERRLVVDNYNILYKSSAKDKQSIESFVAEFRKTLWRPTNITIVDEPIICALLDKQSKSVKEQKLIAEHWIAYSSFDAPEFVWYYPEKN